MVRKLKRKKSTKNKTTFYSEFKDNDVCNCGSGFLYKDCCKGKIFKFENYSDDFDIKIQSDDELPDDEFMKKINKIKAILNIGVKKSKFKQCIHPQQEECKGKIGMKAHSIQNTRVLGRLVRDNHIWIINNDVNNIGPEFKLVGRNQATTFTGFCNEHDVKIFAPIEKENLYSGTEEQHFLYAYRSFARSYHKKLEELKGKSYILSEFELDEHFQAGFEKQKFIINKDFDYYKTEFDDILLSKKYHKLETISIELNYEVKFAVNSFFQLEYDLNNNLLNNFSDFDKLIKPLMLNIFPQNGKSYILLSCFKQDIFLYKEFLETIKKMKKEKLFLTLNNLIAFYCENFVISPDFFDKWSEREKTNFLYKYDISGAFRIPGSIFDLKEKCVYNLFKEI